jgi:hypothetical protein
MAITNDDLFNKLTTVIKKVSEAKAQVANMQAGFGDHLAELLTVFYAFNESFIDTQDKVDKALDTLSSRNFKGNSAAFKELFKELGVADAAIEKILEKKKELDKIDDKQVKKAKSTREMLDLIYRQEKDRVDIAGDLADAFALLNKEVEQQREKLLQLGLPMKNQAKLLEQMVKSSIRVSAMFDTEILDSDRVEENLANIKTMINSVGDQEIEIPIKGKMTVVKFDDAVAVMEDLSRKQLEYIDEEQAIRKAKLKEYVAAANGLRIDLKTNIVTTDKGDALTKKQQAKALHGMAAQVERYEEIVEQIRRQETLSESVLSTLTDTELILLKAAAAADVTLKTYSDALQVNTENLKILHRYAPVMKGIQAVSDKMVGVLSTMSSFLPLGLSRFLGIDEAIHDIQKSTDKSIKTFKAEMLKTGNVTHSVRAALSDFAPALKSALNPMTLLVAGMAALYKFADMVGARYKEITGQMGLSLGQAEKMYKVQLDTVASAKNQILTQEEIGAMQAAMVKSNSAMIGMLDKGGQQMVRNLAEMGKYFGYGAEQAMAIQNVFWNLGASDKLAETLQRDIGYMSELVGLSPQIIAQDLVDAAETVSTYFAGMPEKAARTVVQVRRLGMSLKQAGSIAEKMLDLEGFMTDFYELQSMTAGGVDFTEAFEFGLSGEVEKMTESVMDSIGSLQRWGEMDYLTRRKIAKTIGMEVDELGQAIQNREYLAGFNKDEQKLLEAHLDKVGDISTMSQDQIRAKLKDLQATERLNVAWDKIKAAFTRAILPAVEIFADVLDAVMPVVDIIVAGFKILSPVLKIAFEFVKLLLIPLKLVATILEGIVGKFETVTDGASKAEEKIDQGARTLSGWTGPLADIAKFAGAVLVARFLGLGGIIRRVGGMLFGWTKIFGSIGRGIVGLGRGLVTVGKTGLSAVGRLIPAAGSFVKTMGQGLAGLGPKFVGAFRAGAAAMRGSFLRPLLTVPTFIGKLLFNVVRDLGGMVKTLFAPLGRAALGAVKAAGAGLRGLGNTVLDAFKPVWEGVAGLGRSIGQASKAGFQRMAVQGAAAWTQVKTLGGFVFDKARAAGTAFYTNLTDKLLVAWKPLQAGGVRVWRGLADTASRHWQTVAEMGRNAINNLRPHLSSMWESGRKVGMSVFKTVADFAKKMFPNTASFLSGTFQKAGQMAVPAADSAVKGMVTTAADQAKGLATSAGEAVVREPAKGLTQRAGKAFRNIKAKVTGKPVEEAETKAEKKAKKKAAAAALGEAKSDTLTAEIKEAPPAVKPEPTDVSQTMAEAASDKVKGAVQEKAEALADDAKGKIEEKVQGKAEHFVEKTKDKAGELTRKVQGQKTKDAGPLPAEETKKVKPAKVDDGADALADKAKKMQGKADETTSAVQNGVQKFFNVLKTVWDGVRALLTDIVKFAGDALKTISKAVGDSVAYLLRSLSKGLSSFNQKALVGATALVAVSGALLLTAKAVQAFGSVDWGALGKAGAALGGLVAAAYLLSKASANMFLGAAAIAVLGASLIPAAKALQMFASVSWDALKMAGVALAGLGAAAALFGALSAVIIPGAIALGVLGAALLLVAPAVYILTSALEKLEPLVTSVFAGLSSVVDTVGKTIASVLDAAGKSVERVVGSIKQLADINVVQLFAVAGAITAVGAALLAFSTMGAVSAVGGAIAGIFGGGAMQDLMRLAEVADPLNLAAIAVQTLADGLLKLGAVLASLDLVKLDELHKLKGIIESYSDEMNQQAVPQQMPEPPSSIYTDGSKIPEGIQTPTVRSVMARPAGPPAEATAANVRIKDPVLESTEQDAPPSPFEQALQKATSAQGDAGGTKRMEALLREMLLLLQAQSKRPVQLVLDSTGKSQLASAIKSVNNNI